MKKGKIFSEKHQDERMKLITVEVRFPFLQLIISSIYFTHFSTSLEIRTMLMKSFKAVFYPIKTLLDKNHVINHDSMNTDLNAASHKTRRVYTLNTFLYLRTSRYIYKVVQKNKEYIFLIQKKFSSGT